MANDLLDWISRQAQISGDARQDLIRAARRHKWEMQSFAELICGEPSLHREVVDVCSPFEIAVLSRAWRMDFGAPSPRKVSQRHAANRDSLDERQHYVGGQSHMYVLDDYVPVDEDLDPALRDVPRPREAWAEDNRNPGRPVKVYSSNEKEEATVEPAESPSPPAAAVLVEDMAVAIVASADAIFVAGKGGLKRFDLPDLQLAASDPYAGTADPPGYADLAAGPDFIVCVDLDGCIFRYSKMCELQAKRSYQPSVVEHSQRLIASELQKLSKPIIGLEGGLGGASRLAANARYIYLGGKDGVVTSYSAGTLSLTGRWLLEEGPASAKIGIRAVFLSAYQRLYCAGLSSVYVLAIPAMYQLARLRGGPRVPVFGSISAVMESNAGDLAFVADVGGPSIHVWSTKSWQWISRVELPQGGGPARHLATGNQVLYASTETERLMAFDFSKTPCRCILEGSGGGPLATADSTLVVLSEGKLHLHSYL